MTDQALPRTHLFTTGDIVRKGNGTVRWVVVLVGEGPWRAGISVAREGSHRAPGRYQLASKFSLIEASNRPTQVLAAWANAFATVAAGDPTRPDGVDIDDGWGTNQVTVTGNAHVLGDLILMHPNHAAVYNSRTGWTFKRPVSTRPANITV